MIETIVIDYLNTKLTPIKTYAEEPLAAEQKYIVIEKLAGSIENKIKSSRVAIKSYAGSLFEAASLNESVKATMANIIELNSVSACKLNTDYNFTDTTKKKYRYQAVFDLVYFD